MGDTKIEWTKGKDGSKGKTWNPIRARRKSDGKVGWYCQKVSPGCKNCYAERFNGWTGTHVPYAIDKLPEIELYLDEDVLREPLRWKKPAMVFPCSMTDLFADFVAEEWIHKIYAVMAMCSHLTFQILTKRPERRRDLLIEMRDDQRDLHHWAGLAAEIADSPCAAGLVEDADWPLPNVWEGVSVVNQEEADLLIPILLQTPAAVRWISGEPLLGSLDIGRYLRGRCDAGHDYARKWSGTTCSECDATIGAALDWVVVGGESGPGARPMDVEWARSVMQQCKSAGVPFFMKQGSKANWANFNDFDSFPPDLQIRQFPGEK